ncbi:unnamed protein product [Effrenium voratum]|nr:unnamed protein product [Effrenium voratum]
MSGRQRPGLPHERLTQIEPQGRVLNQAKQSFEGNAVTQSGLVSCHKAMAQVTGQRSAELWNRISQSADVIGVADTAVIAVTRVKSPQSLPACIDTRVLGDVWRTATGRCNMRDRRRFRGKHVQCFERTAVKQSSGSICHKAMAQVTGQRSAELWNRICQSADVMGVADTAVIAVTRVKSSQSLPACTDTRVLGDVWRTVTGRSNMRDRRRFRGKHVQCFERTAVKQSSGSICHKAMAQVTGQRSAELWNRISQSADVIGVADTAVIAVTRVKSSQSLPACTDTRVLGDVWRTVTGRSNMRDRGRLSPKQVC